METSYTEQRYELNRNTSAIIKTKRIAPNLYEHKISLIHKATSLEPLVPKDQAALIALIEDIELENEQTDMFSDKQTEITGGDA